MEIRAMTQEEQKYTYRQSTQLEGQTGSIGYLRGDFADSGYGFYTTWFDTRGYRKTEEFQSEFDAVINALREDQGLLHNIYDMKAFIRKYPDSAFDGICGTEYGFRADTEQYAYLTRCSPIMGEYNFYCSCYKKKWLDRHMENARQGIRFIDSSYKELFRIPDGGEIVITSSWNEKSERSCRFIDEYHMEVGSNLYHICEFAEMMERNGAKYEPKQPNMQKKKGRVR